MQIRSLSLLLFVAACGPLTSDGGANPDDTRVAANAGPMPSLPTADGANGTPWGGADATRWRPEAVMANAVSRGLNDGWATTGASDVIVAVPTRIRASGFREFGDGQDDSAPSFEGWSAPRPPLVATIVKLGDGTLQVRLRVDRTMGGISGQLDLWWKSGSDSVTATQDASGDWVATWTPPASLGWSSSLSRTVVLVHPHGWSDWFPIWFRFPVRKVSDLYATVPGAMNHFPDGGSVVDHEGVSAQTNPGGNPFDRLSSKQFSQPYSFFNPQDIHAQYPQQGHTFVTAVGQGWTWVAPLPPATPFKIMYTCFQGRQPGAEASAPDGGVPSGGGWHVIGDPAETILNDLEAAPLVTGSAENNPLPASQLPSGGYAWGLSDIATVHWLQPGEGFVTAKGGSVTDGNGQTWDQSMYHWYFFQQDRNVCTEEWVHPFAPQADLDFAAPSANVTFTVDNAWTSWGENIYVAGDAPELGGWDPAHAVPLAATAYPTWAGQGSVAQGRRINFKFIKIDGSGNVTWEGGANRSYAVPSGASGAYHGSWQQ